MVVEIEMSNPLRALEHENHELKCRIVDQEANRLRIRELKTQVEDLRRINIETSKELIAEIEKRGKLEADNKFHFSMMIRYMDFIQSKGYQREYIKSIKQEELLT